jgi:hypothetical protein
MRLPDELRKKYSRLVIVTTSTDKGVGGYVRDYCLKHKTSFQLIDLNWKVYASLPSKKLAQVYDWKIPALAVAGEEFHVFVDTFVQPLVSGIMNMELNRNCRFGKKKGSRRRQSWTEGREGDR